MKEFDKHIRSKLYNVEMSYSDSTWDGIEEALFPKKYGRRWWLLFLLGTFVIPIFLLSSSATNGFIFNNNPTEQPEEPTHIEETSIAGLIDKTSPESESTSGNVVDKIPGQSELVNSPIPVISLDEKLPLTNLPSEINENTFAPVHENSMAELISID